MPNSSMPDLNLPVLPGRTAVRVYGDGREFAVQRGTDLRRDLSTTR